MHHSKVRVRLSEMWELWCFCKAFYIWTRGSAHDNANLEETMILDLILMGGFHELLEFFNAEGMRQWNTFLAIVRSFKLSKRMMVLGGFLFLVGRYFLIWLGLSKDGGMPGVWSNSGAISLYEGGNNDRIGGAACSPFILRWTDFFILEAEIVMVLEAGMEGAMVGSPSCSTMLDRTDTVQ